MSYYLLNFSIKESPVDLFTTRLSQYPTQQGRRSLRHLNRQGRGTHTPIVTVNETLYFTFVSTTYREHPKLTTKRWETGREDDTPEVPQTRYTQYIGPPDSVLSLLTTGRLSGTGCRLKPTILYLKTGRTPCTPLGQR